jgi:hypothetical protein
MKWKIQKIHSHLMHLKSDDFKLPRIIKFAWLVTFDNITYVRPRTNDSLTSMKTFDVIFAHCVLWLVITYANIIGNDVL